MKTMRLVVYSLETIKDGFTCEICHNRGFKIIFFDRDNSMWYCATCLMKELNKP